MRAILLAAGFATRLYPLTRDRAKPLLEVAGQPVLTHILGRVLRVPELDGVVVVTNGKFRHQLDEWRAGLDVAVPVEIVDDGATDDTDKLGAIADLELAMRRVPAGDEVVVLAGDNLLEFDLLPYLEAFQRAGRPLLLCRRLQGPVPPGRYGEIRVDEHGTVTSFREKPDDPQSDLAATCMYFFTPAVREQLTAYLRVSDNSDAPGYFLQWLVRRMPVQAMPFEGRFFDIGNRASLERARAEYRGAP